MDEGPAFRAKSESARRVDVAAEGGGQTIMETSQTVADSLTPRTHGVDHIGLTVRDLASTLMFFREGLGWRVVGERKDYPAAFITDGWAAVTLWQAESPTTAVAFNRRANVGLHHLALAVVDRPSLDALHQRLSRWPGVTIEFGPEPVGSSAKTHFMALEPGGLRLDFAFDPRNWIKGI
jgi:catechol 2,3-dioxygenase-like lactoylglutathione lyase family enzyme